MVKENLRNVEERVAKACLRSGRKREDVTLIAVSKTKPVSMIEEVLEEGVLDFGENKPQELKEKYEVLPENIRWHMIGHLQRNKIKYIIDKACLIHSVDSERLAQAISDEAGKRGIVMPVLVEVNIAREASKDGIFEENAEEFIKNISKLPYIHVEGLMAIAPFVENPEENREYFKKLRKLYVDIKSKNIDNVNMCNLSMGMTGDFEVAIEEGATLVRVGTGIFGDRDYSVR
ncbi:YggS family pyridoxal phosphate-dependent enzyme [Murimonas intestini]|uniref:Pyridoxal phosphate homeostasis protein n=1 Tax=Murimonas intestini TaxID=1337051 RepID=A0AB73TAG7_9FIRM|nr:YggS family pyridoxal phosphate-dependent enzyme [Murimonas intestini]MCR1839052.1 YggS family pyridoxal phosphate-dependent enzyme [Murimonas intestini]MCR1864348.1 YggS family pyridoxal phosphate-dependent enzyme [Murimonas intestini]MCR1881958.1 YggS family pyridoxal phosphate-dependent enzyme [Murimonas intestini]